MGRAMSNNPTTWDTLEQALSHRSDPGIMGVGFMFGESGFFGIDFDGCVDPATGAILPAVVAVLARFPTYMEFSPSGTGIHVIGIGRKPEGAGCKKLGAFGCKQVEIYDKLRWFAFTGNRFRIAFQVPDGN
jgi:primase-polymerase (primpol)-like protein